MNARAWDYETTRSVASQGAGTVRAGQGLSRVPSIGEHATVALDAAVLAPSGEAAPARGAGAADRVRERFLQKNLGNWNPVGCLVSVIDDPSGAAGAALALRAAGFLNEHIRIISAAELLAHFGGTRGNSFLAQIACFVADWSDYASFTAEYVDEARRGHYIVMVYAPALDQAHLAHAAIGQFGARLVRHYETWMVRGLAR